MSGIKFEDAARALPHTPPPKSKNGDEMNKKQVSILIIAAISFVFCIFINLSGLTSVFSSNEATTTLIIDLRPMLAELLITAIIFGIIFLIFKTPKKKS